MSEMDWSVEHPGNTSKTQKNKYNYIAPGKIQDSSVPDPAPTVEKDVSGLKSQAAARIWKFAYYSLKGHGRKVTAERLKKMCEKANEDQVLDLVRKACCHDSLYERSVKLADKYYPVGVDENSPLKQRTWEGLPFDQREVVSPIINETILEEEEYPDEVFGGPAVKMRFAFLNDLPDITVSHEGREGRLRAVAGRKCAVDWYDGGQSVVDTASVEWKLLD